MIETLAQLESGFSVVAVRTEYVKLAGTLHGGVLLSQIAYWHRLNINGKSKLRVFRNSVYWVAKTREEWMAETGLNLYQYKTAIKELVALGVVETKVMKFAGVAQTHLRLLVPQLIAKLDGCPTTNSMVAGEPTAWLSEDQPYTETTDIDYVHIKADATEVAEEKEVQTLTKQVPHKLVEEVREIADWMAERPVLAEQKAGKFTAGEWLLKAQDLLKNCQGKMGLREVRLTANSLSMAWKRTVSEEYGGIAKELTHKEIGQLKMFLTKSGEYAPQAMAAVLGDWGGFAFEARCQKGLSTAPHKPTIGFLLQYYDVAVNMYLQSIAKPTPEKKAQNTYCESTINKTSTKPKEGIATIEDVMAALATYGS